MKKSYFVALLLMVCATAVLFLILGRSPEDEKYNSKKHHLVHAALMENGGIVRCWSLSESDSHLMGGFIDYIDPATGKTIWKHQTDITDCRISLSGNRIIFTNHFGAAIKLVAYTMEGKVAWERSTSLYEHEPTTVVTDSHLAIVQKAEELGHIFVVDGATGEVCSKGKIDDVFDERKGFAMAKPFTIENCELKKKNTSHDLTVSFFGAVDEHIVGEIRQVPQNTWLIKKDGEDVWESFSYVKNSRSFPVGGAVAFDTLGLHDLGTWLLVDLKAGKFVLASAESIVQGGTGYFSNGVLYDNTGDFVAGRRSNVFTQKHRRRINAYFTKSPRWLSPALADCDEETCSKEEKLPNVQPKEEETLIAVSAHGPRDAPMLVRVWGHNDFAPTLGRVELYDPSKDKVAWTNSSLFTADAQVVTAGNDVVVIGNRREGRKVDPAPYLGDGKVNDVHVVGLSLVDGKRKWEKIFEGETFPTHAPLVKGDKVAFHTVLGDRHDDISERQVVLAASSGAICSEQMWPIETLVGSGRFQLTSDSLVYTRITGIQRFSLGEDCEIVSRKESRSFIEQKLHPKLMKLIAEQPANYEFSYPPLINSKFVPFSKPKQLEIVDAVEGKTVWSGTSDRKYGLSRQFHSLIEISRSSSAWLDGNTGKCLFSTSGETNYSPLGMLVKSDAGDVTLIDKDGKHVYSSSKPLVESCKKFAENFSPHLPYSELSTENNI